MKKGRQIAVIAVFACILAGFAASHILLPDQELSKAERRRLAALPELTKEGVLSKTYMEDMEGYLMDQFPLREELRASKAFITLALLRQKDVHQIYPFEGGLYKWESQFKPREIEYFAGKVNDISRRYLKNSQVYYSIIPDKDYYIAEKSGRPYMDYDRLFAMVNEKVTEAQYIDITGALNENSYYKADTHWKQTSLLPVYRRLGMGMGFFPSLKNWQNHALRSEYPFYGVYRGQSAILTDGEHLEYMANDTTRNAVVTSAEASGTLPVYNVEKFDGLDGYDLFLNGAQAVMTIENRQTDTDRELILFRDSFGSSLAPLLIDTYAKITLIDLRYIATDYLPQFVDFADQDVLFIYSASLINGAMVLK